MLKRIVALLALTAAALPASGVRAGGPEVPGGLVLTIRAPETYQPGSPVNVSGFLYAWAAAPVLVEVARAVPEAPVEIFVDDVRVAEATTDIQGFYSVDLTFDSAPPWTRTIYAQAYSRVPIITTRSASVDTRLARILIDLDVTPGSLGLQQGQTGSLAAIGLWDDGRESDVSEHAGWTSTNPAVATVSNEAGQRGTVTAVAPGTATIRASLNGLIASATVTVTA